MLYRYISNGKEMKTEKTSGGIIFLLIIIIALALFMFKTIISLN